MFSMFETKVKSFTHLDFAISVFTYWYAELENQKMLIFIPAISSQGIKIILSFYRRDICFCFYLACKTF